MHLTDLAYKQSGIVATCPNPPSSPICVQRRENLGLPPGDTDPALDELSDDEYTFLEDPPELVEARSRLAAYTYRQDEEEPAGGKPEGGEGYCRGSLQRGTAEGYCRVILQRVTSWIEGRVDLELTFLLLYLCFINMRS